MTTVLNPPPMFLLQTKLSAALAQPGVAGAAPATALLPTGFSSQPPITVDFSTSLDTRTATPTPEVPRNPSISTLGAAPARAQQAAGGSAGPRAAAAPPAAARQAVVGSAEPRQQQREPLAPAQQQPQQRREAQRSTERAAVAPAGIPVRLAGRLGPVAPPLSASEGELQTGRSVQVRLATGPGHVARPARPA